MYLQVALKCWPLNFQEGKEAYYVVLLAVIRVTPTTDFVLQVIKSFMSCGFADKYENPVSKYFNSEFLLQ